MERDFPEKLAQYALALSHAQTLYRMATRASDPVRALSGEGMKLRSLLFSDARALVHRGLVDGQVLRSYKGSVGYGNLAFDLPSTSRGAHSRKGRTTSSRTTCSGRSAPSTASPSRR